MDGGGRDGDDQLFLSFFFFYLDSISFYHLIKRERYSREKGGGRRSFEGILRLLTTGGVHFHGSRRGK